MGRTAAAGAFQIGTSQFLRVVLTILSTIIVARILAPEDYGIIAMVSPVMGFLLLFQNLGLSHAAVQARTLSSEQSTALFWVNMTASAIIASILLLLAPVVSWFYGEPRAAYITAASAANVLVSGSTIQHLALFNRELRFRILSRVDIGASVTTFVATVVAALVLRSYWALWLGSFLGFVLNAVLVWKHSAWRPSLQVSFAGSRNLIRFGASITGFNLLNFLSRNVDNVLIGRVWGTTALGLYDRSYRLMMFPLQNINAPLSRVMLPILSRLRDDEERFRRSYLMALRGILILSTPAIAVAGATSDRLIPFLLGDQWSNAAPIFLWLSLAALFQPLSNTTGWLYISTGRGRALMRWGAASTSVTIVAFVVGVNWGPVGVAAAYFISSAAKLPFLFRWCTNGTPVHSRDLYSALAPSVAVAVVVWTALSWAPAQWSLIALLSMALPGAYLLCILFHWFLPGGKPSLKSLATLAASLPVVRRGLGMRGESTPPGT
jgi:polysaccharide transporter, PST family